MKPPKLRDSLQNNKSVIFKDNDSQRMTEKPLPIQGD